MLGDICVVVCVCGGMCVLGDMMWWYMYTCGGICVGDVWWYMCVYIPVFSSFSPW